MRRRFHVNVIHAHACTAHHAQLLRALQQLRRHLRRAAHHKPIGRRKLDRQCARRASPRPNPLRATAQTPAR